MKTTCTTTAVLAFAFSVPALAQQTDHRLGEHPAVIVKRLQAQQGYDYASKFYPHPAWLYLYAEAPHPMMDHPAVIVFKRQQEATVVVRASHPALAPRQKHETLAAAGTLEPKSAAAASR